MHPLVYIILLNWNGYRDTVAAVESCCKLSYPNARILIVDNASSDGSENAFRQVLPACEVLQAGSNLGFAGGNNVGIRHALAQGADYVWLLNNDTVVAPDALSTLITIAEQDASVGIVGSKILYYDHKDLLWFAGAVLDPERPHRPAHIGLNEKDRGQYDAVRETGYVTGCSLLVRKETLEQVGLLDDDLFLYFEDVDWSARAKTAGWKLMYCPQSVVYHKVSASTGGAASPALLYYTSRNRLYFVKRNFPNKLLAALCYNIYEHVLVSVKKGRFSCAIAALQGIWDFLIHKTGKR